MTLPQDKNLDVLIVDDNKIDREAIRRYLASPVRGYRFTFHEADSAKDGVRMMQERAFDCVFLDYRLPDADGIAVLRQTHNPDTGLTPSPVVMLTGQGSETVMLDALRLGAQDYLMKENLSHESISIAMVKARELHAVKCAQRHAEEQLHHTRKMEAVGQLTSGIAHDFNNLLTVVTGNIHLLRRRIGAPPGKYPPEDIEEKVAAIEAAAEKGAELVRRLMIFTRQTPLSQEVIDPADTVRETFELLRRSLGDGIEVDMLLKEDTWPVCVDPGQFENILINFAVNARDAMPKGGKITVETDNVMLDESYTFGNPDAASGPYVMISISDTGLGMTAETKKRVFEPFFTTKPEGEGTGLGMSMAYGFVRQSGGHIHVYSEEGHGTIFRVYLPKVRTGEETDLLADPAKLPIGRETVLVVEDDEIMRTVAITMLEKLGYATLHAQDARVALEILKGAHRSIALVFTDIVMSGSMSGMELAGEIHRHYPDISVLYASGYSPNAIPDYNLAPGEALLSKPYRLETLARQVRAVLDEKEARYA